MRLLVVAASVLLSACSAEITVKSSDVSIRVRQAVLGMVARCPLDPEGLAAAFEESDFIDMHLDRGVWILVEEGKLEMTDQGLRVVPMDQWPVQAEAQK